MKRIGLSHNGSEKTMERCRVSGMLAAAWRRGGSLRGSCSDESTEQ